MLQIFFPSDNLRNVNEACLELTSVASDIKFLFYNQIVFILILFREALIVSLQETYFTHYEIISFS